TTPFPSDRSLCDALAAASGRRPRNTLPAHPFVEEERAPTNGDNVMFPRIATAAFAVALVGGAAPTPGLAQAPAPTAGCTPSIKAANDGDDLARQIQEK